MRSILLFAFFILQSLTISAQYEWEEKTSLPSSARERVFSFMIDDIIYVGTGRTNSGNTDQFWAYDTSTDTWQQKANYPGGAIRNGVGFSIGEFGYAGFGYTGSGHSNTFWKYNPIDDSWLQISSPFSSGVSFATGLSNDEYGFICFGEDGTSYSNKIWRYAPESDSWDILATLPAPGRWMASGFIIDDKIYVGGGGRSSSAMYHDFWMYDLETNNWSQLGDLPIAQTLNCPSFVINSKIVLAEGCDAWITPSLGFQEDEVYIYDATTDNWQPGPSFPAPRVYGFLESRGNIGFVGLGAYLSFSAARRSDVYQFSEISTAIEQIVDNTTTIFPNPTSRKVEINTPYTLSHLEIYDKEGRLLRTQHQENGHREVDLSAFPAGTYFLILGDKDQQKVISKKVVKR